MTALAAAMICPRRAIVLDQELRSCTVVGLELADEVDGRAGEGVDVLVVIAHGKQAEAKLRILQRAACNGRDQRIFLRADVLILVDQNPAITLDQRFALGFCLGLAQPFAVQLAHRFHDDAVEVVRRLAS